MPKLLFTLLILLGAFNYKTDLPDSKRASDVRDNVWPKLQTELESKNLKMGGVYLRIFKSEHVLEVWVKAAKEYQLFKSYEVCFFSGGLGTKTRSGDGKSPE